MVSIRQHTSAYLHPHELGVGVLLRDVLDEFEREGRDLRERHDAIRQHTSAYVSIRQHTHLFERHDGYVVEFLLLPRLHQLVVHLART